LCVEAEHPDDEIAKARNPPFFREAIVDILLRDKQFSFATTSRL